MLPRLVLTDRRRGVWRRVCQWSPRREMWIRLRTGRLDVTCLFRPFKGWCWRATRLRGDTGPVALTVCPPPEVSMRRIKPGGSAEGSPAKHLAAVESDVLSRLPNLVSHCCVIKYDDGESRRPGWWTVKTMGSAWVVEVKDPDSCCRIQATGNTLDDAMALADLLLGAEQAPWEPDPWLASSQARGKKKAS